MRRLLFSLLWVILIVGCGGDEPQATVPTALEPTLQPLTPTLVTELVGDTAVTPQVTTEKEVIETVQPTQQPPTSLPPTPTAVPVAINGISSADFIIMAAAVRDNIRNIANEGQAQGRDARAFSILGDSLIATPQSIAHWDGDTYVLGSQYAYLQPTIDHYRGHFGDYGPSVRIGLHSWSVFDPLWSDKTLCEPNEDLLTCEIRLTNPSVMIIFLGSNDAGSPGGFNVNMRQVIDTLIAQGIVPVLATKADRFEGPDNANNNIIRDIASEYKLPLMDFDQLAESIPGRGLSGDNVHLTYAEPYDYTSPDTLALGYPVHNLAMLMTLDAVRQEIGS